MKALRFNQDATCCVITHNKIVSIYNCDPFGECFNINWEENSDKEDSNNNQSNISNRGSSGGQINLDIKNKRNGGGDNNSEVFEVDQQSNNNLFMVNEYEECIVEMLFSTSLIAMTNGNITNRRKLKIINTKRNSTICELVFPTDIIDVVMNRKRLCVLLSNDQIFVYDISCMKLLDTIDLRENKIKLQFQNNSDNDKTDYNNVNKLLKNELDSKHDVGHFGLNSKLKSTPMVRRDSIRSKIGPKISLSNGDRSILAFSTYHTSKTDPNNSILRDIVIYDAMNVKPVNYLNNVHRNNISCIAINNDGTLITTASEKGTIIRVYNTGINNFNTNDNLGAGKTLTSFQFNCKTPLLTEFRRGNRPSNIYQLKFNSSSTLIGCVGDTGTVHIFKLNDSIPHSETTNFIPRDIDSRLSLINSNSSNQDSNGDETHNSGYSNKLNLERSKQVAHFLSKKFRATIPNQNLQRDFAHININDTTTRYCLGFSDEFPNQIYLAGDDGQFFTYAIPQTSGKCILVSKNTFF